MYVLNGFLFGTSSKDENYCMWQRRETIESLVVLALVSVNTYAICSIIWETEPSTTAYKLRIRSLYVKRSLKIQTQWKWRSPLINQLIGYRSVRCSIMIGGQIDEKRISGPLNGGLWSEDDIRFFQYVLDPRQVWTWWFRGRLSVLYNVP